MQDCENHPGWLEPQITYLDLWYGLLERIKDVTKSKEVGSALALASRTFVESHKLLPGLAGKVYKGLKDGTCFKPVSIWDDSAFEKLNTTKAENFVPRWMTVNSGERVSNRVRLAYTFTAPSQKRYMGRWQRDVEIKEKKPNFAVLHPSPPPFEYPWMKANYNRIISERGYMVWKEGVPAARFHPEGKRYGIGHDWWNADHTTISCGVCRTWNSLNPLSMEGAESDVLDPKDPSLYNRGGRAWGYFACWSVSLRDHLTVHRADV